MMELKIFLAARPESHEHSAEKPARNPLHLAKTFESRGPRRWRAKPFRARYSAADNSNMGLRSQNFKK